MTFTFDGQEFRDAIKRDGDGWRRADTGEWSPYLVASVINYLRDLVRARGGDVEASGRKISRAVLTIKEVDE